MAKRLEEELQGKGGAEKIDPDNEARSPEKTMGKALGSATADSGIGTFQSKSSATTSVKRRTTTAKLTTVKGSLSIDSIDEGVSMSNKKQNFAYDPAALKLQKQEMKKLGFIRDHRKDRINRWKVIQELGLIRDHKKDKMNRWKVAQMMEEVDLGEGDSPEQTFSINKLLMSGFRPSIDALKIFSAHLQDIELQVEEIDLSNNCSLEEDHIQYVGDIIRHSKVKGLILQNCGFNPGLLLGLKKSLNATMLTKLDVSHNPHIGPDGMTLLGKDIVRMCQVQSLSLRNCGLTAQHMIKLKESLFNAKFSEIDVSCNTDLKEEGMTQLGEIVHRTRATTLILRNCQLSPKAITCLKNSLVPAKLEKLDVSENSQLAPDGMSLLGDIVRRSEVKTLLLRECMLSPADILAMKQSLDGYKMMELDLGRKKAPARALSLLDSQSSATSDEASSDNDGSEDDENDSVPKPPVMPLEMTPGKLEESTYQSVVQEPMSENSSGGRKSEEGLIVAAGTEQPALTVEDMIANLLPNVDSYLRMDNWEIEKALQEVLLKEMKLKELYGLKITYGRPKASGFATLSIRKKVGFQSSATDAEDASDDEGLPSVAKDELEFTVAQHLIGPEGKEIDVEGFVIKIPPGAVPKETSFTFKPYIGTHPPKNVTFITPVLLCEPDGYQLKENITITAPCWCRGIDEKESVEVFIYSQVSGSNRWDFEKKHFLGQNYKITFTCDHFSGSVCGVETSDENMEKIIYRLEYLLFANTDKIFHSAVLSVNDTVRNNLVMNREKHGLLPIFPGGDHLEILPRKKIAVGLRSNDINSYTTPPTKYSIQPTKHDFAVDENLVDVNEVSRTFSHMINWIPPKSETIILDLNVHDRIQFVEWPKFPPKLKEKVSGSMPSTSSGNAKEDVDGSSPTKKYINMNGFLYGLADQINETVWLRFARTTLDLPNPDVDRIQADERHSTEEKKFQMLLLWTKKNKGTEEKQQEILLQLKESFFASKEESRPRSRGEDRYNRMVTADTLTMGPLKIKKPHGGHSDAGMEFERQDHHADLQ